MKGQARKMNARKGIVAAVGAALLAAGTAGTAAFAIGDGNIGGTATNVPVVTGGTNAPVVVGAVVLSTSGTSASTGSLVDRSHSKGGSKTNANTKAGGNKANASNHGGARGGGVRIGF
jgi:hypothetical protein